MILSSNIDIQYVVFWGRADLKDRQKRITSDYKKAKEIFDFVQKDFHADVFKVTSTTVTEKLT